MTTINHEAYVSLEVAKLLKEAGFDWRCRYAYRLQFQNLERVSDSIYNDIVSNKNIYGCIFAPTLDVAQRWLREVKRISVEPGIDVHGKWKVLCCKYPINNEWPNDWCLLDDTDETNPYYSTYEEAQEAGIKKALELILEKGK